MRKKLIAVILFVLIGVAMWLPSSASALGVSQAIECWLVIRCSTTSKASTGGSDNAKGTCGTAAGYGCGGAISTAIE